jgi:hypothetical protein
MRALNGPSMPKNYSRLLSTPEGRRLAYLREELAERLCDPAYIASFARERSARRTVVFSKRLATARMGWRRSRT